MNYKVNNWYTWPGYGEYKWNTDKQLTEYLGLSAKSTINVQLVDEDRVLRQVYCRLVGNHDWTAPCLFQVVSIYVEPNTIWVNEYSTKIGAYSVHDSKTSAQLSADKSPTPPVRTAVQYREVK